MPQQLIQQVEDSPTDSSTMNDPKPYRIVMEDVVAHRCSRLQLVGPAAYLVAFPRCLHFILICGHTDRICQGNPMMKHAIKAVSLF